MAMTLLRSAATNMARAPPRLPYPTTSGGLWLSRFSTSTGGRGSMPPSANLRGLQTYNKKVSSGNEWGSFKTGFIGAAPMTAYGMVFGSYAFIYFYFIPALDRIDAKFDAFCDQLDAYNEDMEHQQNEAHDSMGSQIEAKDVGEFSKGTNIGTR